ncbi:PREDICTED: uncharacterized protein LOC109173347 [Ipomoea nil]|uniref:uncharacterized protein LOC109173347 n=1 Tax=Ipomoea nil TaxID=35883 RepID=UPI000900D6E3|nr:PREDICTED: uncharacterized protein LOC109173347 [Ipomoea nil]
MGASEKNATARVSTLPLLLDLLPQDILFEILSKLRAKSLVRFRNFELLQVDGGRVAIVLVRQIDRQFYMDVWTWEKSKECWEKTIMTIPLEESRIIYGVTGVTYHLRYTTNPVGEIVLLCMNSKRFTILVCNLKNEVWRQFNVGGVEEFPNLCLTDVRIYRTMDSVFSLEQENFGV